MQASMRQRTANTLIYHHEKLQRIRKRSSILQLKNHEGKLVEGHQSCASLLQDEARALLDNTSTLDTNAQEELLAFVEEVFTEADNKLLDKAISDEDVKASLLCANRNLSPGSDGITYLTYLSCWNSLGLHLSDVIREIVKESKIPKSMKNCFLVLLSQDQQRKLNKNQGQEEALSPANRLQGPLWHSRGAPQEDREPHHLSTPICCWLQKGVTSSLSHQRCN